MLKKLKEISKVSGKYVQMLALYKKCNLMKVHKGSNNVNLIFLCCEVEAACLCIHT